MDFASILTPGGAAQGFSNLAGSLAQIPAQRRHAEILEADQSMRRQSMAQAFEEQKLNRQARAADAGFRREQFEADKAHRQTSAEQFAKRLELDQRKLAMDGASDVRRAGADNIRALAALRQAKAAETRATQAGSAGGDGMNDNQRWTRAVTIAKAAAGIDEVTGMPNPVSPDDIQAVYDGLGAGRIAQPGTAPEPAAPEPVAEKGRGFFGTIADFFSPAESPYMSPEEVLSAPHEPAPRGLPAAATGGGAKPPVKAAQNDEVTVESLRDFPELHAAAQRAPADRVAKLLKVVNDPRATTEQIAAARAAFLKAHGTPAPMAAPAPVAAPIAMGR